MLDGIEVDLGSARFPKDTFQGQTNYSSSWLQVDAACASCGLFETLQVFVADGEAFCGEGRLTQFTAGAVQALVNAARNA